MCVANTQFQIHLANRDDIWKTKQRFRLWTSHNQATQSQVLLHGVRNQRISVNRKKSSFHWPLFVKTYFHISSWDWRPRGSSWSGFLSTVLCWALFTLSGVFSIPLHCSVMIFLEIVALSFALETNLVYQVWSHIWLNGIETRRQSWTQIESTKIAICIATVNLSQVQYRSQGSNFTLCQASNKSGVYFVSNKMFW